MAIQWNVATRNGMLDAIETTNGTSCAIRIFTGAPPANTGAANSGTALATINLPADWMAAASNGSKAKSGTWQGTASASGTAGHFRVYNSQTTLDGTTCFMQGTAGLSGTDMILDNDSFATGQTFTITTFTLTAPGA